VKFRFWEKSISRACSSMRQPQCRLRSGARSDWGAGRLRFAKRSYHRTPTGNEKRARRNAGLGTPRSKARS